MSWRRESSTPLLQLFTPDDFCACLETTCATPSLCGRQGAHRKGQRSHCGFLVIGSLQVLFAHLRIPRNYWAPQMGFGLFVKTPVRISKRAQYQVAVCECAVFTCLLSDGSRTEPESKPGAKLPHRPRQWAPQSRYRRCRLSEAWSTPRGLGDPRDGSLPSPAPCECFSGGGSVWGAQRAGGPGLGAPEPPFLRERHRHTVLERTETVNPGSSLLSEQEPLMGWNVSSCTSGSVAPSKRGSQVPEWSSNSSGRGRGRRAGSAEWFRRAPV